jgi:transposase-like protein
MTKKKVNSRYYTQQQRDDAVAKVLAGATIHQVAKDLGAVYQSVATWVKNAETTSAKSLRKENSELRVKIVSLQQEIDYLRNMILAFAKANM